MARKQPIAFSKNTNRPKPPKKPQKPHPKPKIRL
mgnify:CR=1 FL=1|tara:strand:- start:393 stop:494 length:102 start_codon:yes stop_codon:yes gene_type:complete